MDVGTLASAGAIAREIVALWPAIYLPLHARTEPRARQYRPTPESLGVLTHLAASGPLTVTEAARHMRRAQSVMSDIVTRLERRGLLERMRDERDRRRVLVWLTPGGQATLAREQRVLDESLVGLAVEKMSPRDRSRLLAGMRALAEAAHSLRRQGEEPHGDRKDPQNPPRKPKDHV
jgi:DNA-binding MarR family transcriptional regulator